MKKNIANISSRFRNFLNHLQKIFLDEPGSEKPLFRYLAVFTRVGVLLAIYLAIHTWFRHAAELPETSYRKYFIFFEIINHLGFPEILVILFIIFIAGMFNRKTIWKSWPDFDRSDKLRWFITIVAGVLAWSFSTYDMNYYYNEEHVFDRVLLVLLAAMIYWKPGFIFPFLLLLQAVINQFNYPLGVGYSRPMDHFLMGILTIFSAAYILNGLARSRRITDFLFLTCCLLAAQYWWPGLGKIKLNWVTHGHIYFLPLAAYAHGWLAFLEPETIIRFAKIESWLDWPMLIATAILEWGALFFLWRRSLAKCFMIAWICFHLAILANTGYFFWKWMIVEAALLILFFRRKTPHIDAIFRREYFVCSILLIGGVILWFKPAALAWYDTRLSYTYRFIAVGESGATYELSPAFFQPYNDVFAFSDFGYLTPRAQLVGPYGATASRATTEALLQTKTPEKIFQLEAQKQPKTVNPRQLERFDNFFKRYIRNLNHRMKHNLRFNWLQPPPVFITFSRGRVFNREEPLKKIIVNQVTTLFNDRQLLEIRNTTIREIDIPQQ
jgi:hypothetical protein